jgi:uncharacterized membrane protein
MAYRNPEIEQLRAQVAALTERVHRLEAAAGLPVTTEREALEEGTRPPPPAAPRAPAARPRRLLPADRVRLESQIGSQWLNRIGIVAVLIGVSYFLRHAFENDWVGPAGQVALGLLAGIGVVLWSERFRTHGYLAFAWSLKAIGIGTLYLSIWAAFQMYHLVPLAVAFGAMAAVTASTAVLALRQNAVILAAFALLGGYATPVLLSTGVSRPVELFVYVALLNTGALVMARYRPWAPLLAGAFIGTTSLYAGWHASFFTADDRAVAFAFATVFFAMFAAVPLLARYPPHHDRRDGPVDADSFWKVLVAPALLLLPLGNAAVYFLQLVALLEPVNRNVPPAAALLLATVYLALGSLVKDRRVDTALTPTLALLHAGVAIAFVTIAIPLRLDAHWMTIGWLVEAAALLWIAERADSRLVRGFGIVALALAILRLLVIDDFRTDLVLLNQRFLTFAVALALLAAIAWGGQRTGRMSGQALAATTIVLNTVALVALSREVDAYFRPAVRFVELNSSTPLTDASAARDFAYSAIWMGYGALVMAAGFLLRWTLLRWQALILVGLTIVKVFVYDLANLDQAYRILSFIALGLLLMAISFAYQRDWLKLREEGGTASRTESV